MTQPNFEIQLTGKMFLFFRYIYIISEITSKYENDMGVNRQTCEHLVDVCIYFFASSSWKSPNHHEVSTHFPMDDFTSFDRF